MGFAQKPLVLADFLCNRHFCTKKSLSVLIGAIVFNRVADRLSNSCLKVN